MTVYYAKCRDFVKIGFTRGSPHERARELQTGCPEPIEIVAVEAGNAATERERHAQFAAHFVGGEWYRFDGALVASDKWAAESDKHAPKTYNYEDKDP